jgi:hypothetical protein
VRVSLMRTRARHRAAAQPLLQPVAFTAAIAVAPASPQAADAQA